MILAGEADMPTPKYTVALTDQQRQQIQIVARSYRHSARERSRAQILLLADQNREAGALNTRQIAQEMQCLPLHVEKTRQRAHERGAVESLKHKQQERRKPRKIDGEAEASLIAIACSQAPKGRSRWTLQLLADKLIQMEIVESIDASTVYRTMKKTHLSLG